MANHLLSEITAHRYLDEVEYGDSEECLGLPSGERSNRRGKIFQALRLEQPVVHLVCPGRYRHCQ